MIKSIPYLIISLAVFSCAPRGGGEDASLASAFAEAITAGGEPYNEDQRATGVRVCSAYRAKAINFRGLPSTNQFNYQTDVTNCSGNRTFESRINSTVIERLGQLKIDSVNFQGPQVPFNDIQTDSVGPLSVICQRLRTVQTTEPALNVIDNFEGQRVEVTFLTSPQDGYQVRYASLNSVDNLFQVNRVDRFLVETNPTISGNLLGLVSERVSVVNCQAGSAQERSTAIQIYQEN